MLLLSGFSAPSLSVLGIAFCGALGYACVAPKEGQKGRNQMQTKGLSCKLPLELHDRISEEIRQSGVTVSQFVEAVINEHYAKGASNMGRTRTMAFQVSEELFQQIKAYLIRYEQVYRRKLTQREFVIGLIECALEEAEDEFGALETVREDERTEEETEMGMVSRW